MLERLTPKAILFDFYGTLVDIGTDEHDLYPWDVVAKFLHYRGSRASGAELQRDYFGWVADALKKSPHQPNPDIDVLDAFAEVIAKHGVDATRELAYFVAQLYRSLTIRRFELFPEVLEVLEPLSQRFRLALVSDSQEPYIFSELRIAGLARFFPVVVCSAHAGYRKPDKRLFSDALQTMNLTESEVVYVGDSTERDVVGASNAGIQAIWIRRHGAHQHTEDLPDVIELPDLRGLLAIGTHASP